ncbi:MAG: bifunctional diaminohydroxyphosphoribosylaminopyrimidine deaminase/5-amino-6-(5-phosphoribosylamino)uracil reductase RibD [Terriglobia bacterium]|nr:bifunctional diaminohydroxyphosphoribosylaminopyrimidine deaminase/5-amino-6-(5-phosphoribosylamino)uracil reductase RibD [Terriglobia bacterium]
MAHRNHDELFMKQALDLARQGIGLASPNPCVGALIVDERGRIVGRGTHTYEGKKHAEILAIEEAGEKARGNTLYINLEPCSHVGRTGPCADAVIAAGIQRVVASMRDPNPLVSGEGFARLQAAGIEVLEGILEEPARKLNETFARYIRTHVPFGILKTAMTLDGKIGGGGVSHNPTALGSGHASIYITGEESRHKVHELRHECDAIMVGVGTVVADDPLLTDRSGRPRRRKLLRVILDSRLRLPIESRVVQTCDKDVIVFCAFGEEKKRAELEKRGIIVEQVQLPALQVVGGRDALPHDGRPDLPEVFRRLGALEITSVLVEGGAMVNWACLQAGVIDKLWLFFAPKLLGGEGSVPFLSSGHAQLSEAIRVKNIALHRYGDDFAVEGYLRDTYEE